MKPTTHDRRAVVGEVLTRLVAAAVLAVSLFALFTGATQMLTLVMAAASAGWLSSEVVNGWRPNGTQVASAAAWTVEGIVCVSLIAVLWSIVVGTATERAETPRQDTQDTQDSALVAERRMVLTLYHALTEVSKENSKLKQQIKTMGDQTTTVTTTVTAAEVAALVEKVTGSEASRMTADTDIFSDAGADSLDFVEVLMEAEKRWDVRITDDEARDVRTVGALARLVQEKINTAR